MCLPTKREAPSSPQFENSAELPRSQKKQTRRGPIRADVLDAAGNRIGKVRGGAFYSLEGAFFGRFVSMEEGVFLAHEGEVLGVLDGDRVLSAREGEHLCTLRRNAWGVWLLFLTVAALFFACFTLGFAYRFFPASMSGITDFDYQLTGSGSEWNIDIDLPAAWGDAEGELIAPGMSGEYRFTIRNGSPVDVTGVFRFEEDNEAGIEMLYRLRQNGELISSEEFVPLDELELSSAYLSSDSTSAFVLEWYWSHNDPVDTWVGENGAYYAVGLAFRAVPAE